LRIRPVRFSNLGSAVACPERVRRCGDSIQLRGLQQISPRRGGTIEVHYWPLLLSLSMCMARWALGTIVQLSVKTGYVNSSTDLRNGGMFPRGHGLVGHGLASHSFTLRKSHTKDECFYKSMPNFDATLLSHPAVDLPIASWSADSLVKCQTWLRTPWGSPKKNRVVRPYGATIRNQ
jgi:hypothetical protein